ncbi:PadR family transcriptional regulator [Actinomadura barringtoniae]|uniref:PadR family transcriptional regulator n=1 Tax=Actinomadura barringtoniae TaxID=1427535 RepID=A0A939PDJ5_9ACTN|nr:PadR family transcriptional regulator [Actinomadura barringtoniae]MBO2450635.1 PadR family transcriptional regulator [Actinomadura barringtoniae]
MAGGRGRTTPLALAVLTTLIEGPMHPYEIAQLLKHRGKDQSIKIRFGSLYTVVQSLENRGLVEAEGTTRAGRRPERTVYRITDAGRDEITEVMRELLSEPVKEYPRFESALSLLGALSSDDVAEQLGRRLTALEREIGEMRAALADARAEGFPRIFLLEVEYALAMKEAEAAWVGAFAAELADGTFADLEAWRAWHDKAQLPAEVREAEWFKEDQALHGHESEAGRLDD